MTNIVVTGSTRGIGFSLVQAFLDRDCAVMLNGRSTSSVESALASLADSADAKRLAGHAADVTAYEEVQGLWDAAQSRFGRVGAVHVHTRHFGHGSGLTGLSVGAHLSGGGPGVQENDRNEQA